MKIIFSFNLEQLDKLKLKATWRNRMLDFQSKEMKTKVSVDDGINQPKDVSILSLIYNTEVGSKFDFKS